MSLLLGTNIQDEVRNKIRGFTARVGGSVNQLVNYKGCVVEDINILDGGFGKVDKLFNTGDIIRLPRKIARYIKQELKFIIKGYSVSRDRKTLLYDMHYIYQSEHLRSKYACSISSNMIEHSPNPIWLLLNFYLITSDCGYQFHAIPHYKYTYDRFRNPTTLEHLIEDFEQQIDINDVSHVEDYRQSAIEKDGWQREFHTRYPITYPFMHFHVFDENNINALFKFMFTDVVNDVYKTNEFSDNVVIFKNELNRNFSGKYSKLIENYMNKTVTDAKE